MQFRKKYSLGVKAITVTLIVFFLAPTSFFLSPKKTEAAWPTFETNPAVLVPTAATAASAAATTKSTGLIVLKEFVLDPLLTEVVKTLLQNFIRSTIDWVQSGFDGGPAFVQNPGKFFATVGNEAGGQFIEEVAPFLCEPFAPLITFSLSARHSGTYFDRIDCTLTDVVGNVEGFLGGDFEQGGWDGWVTLTQNPQNDPYASFVLASQGLDMTIGHEQIQESTKLDWGKGFFSQIDEEGSILTPGAVIEEQLNVHLGSETRQLEVADEINELVSALLSQLVTQLFSGGQGLLGL
ncbi:MAG: hypothetical protein KAR00_03635 [Candidatus Pacebacteria bacterium]|nr:hypothetical protein [Candidatus Paceibacterota bacterium]